ncbi:unconventional myosin-IXAa-like [Oncorhynchus keta]|uniref:unconventional myosin-IXAa-like n=1 Tax=Oncorhynchus keta TaxID=8018 RepID=UPI00227B664D|nr:unconventional myosin-IXAa-like [Oncorhynchus keta]
MAATAEGSVAWARWAGEDATRTRSSPCASIRAPGRGHHLLPVSARKAPRPPRPSSAAWSACVWTVTAATARLGWRGGLPLPATAEESGWLHPLRRQPADVAACDRGAPAHDGAWPVATGGGQGDHADLCCLPELTERSLLDNLRSRFRQERIYTYVGSILIVINPFQFLPIYNPKYVKMYDNHALGDLEPHIYAVADVAYHAMLQRRRNQCIVISGESGSGKTQSTNFLIHHLTALSQKGFASGVEQIILGAGPVLEVRTPMQ